MRSHNNLPVITDLTSAITTAPPTFVFLKLDLGGLQTHFVRIFDGLSFQFIDGTMQIPVSKLVSDQLIIRFLFCWYCHLQISMFQFDGV